jgi:myo-inositol 2-dehydrogenase/D-chiro-inositol 1-dehydrogenase
MRRFDPGYQAMKHAVDGGKFGLPLFLHCVHRNAVGPDYLDSERTIANSSGHDIDIARYLLDEDFVAVSVTSPRASRKARNRQPHLVVLESASGVVVDVEAFVDAQYGYDVRAELVCESGTIALRPNPPVSINQAGLDGFALNPDWRGRFGDAYRVELREWIASIQAGKACGASAWDGYAASATADAAIASYRTRSRQSITLDPRPGLYSTR